MRLNQVRGLAAAESVLTRIDPLDLSSLPDAALERTRARFGPDATPESSILQMLRDVRAEGDTAVRRYAKMLDDSELDSLEVTYAEIDAAWDATPDDLKRALELAAQRITAFHEATLPRDWVDLGGGLGELVRPLERVGLYAPGGTAAYPSTVLMTAIPARVAGVRQVILATPRRGKEPLNSTVLAAARVAGVDAVYQVGGVPAIGAMAYGTESIRKVDKICGPGNVFVAYAKRMVQGQVDIDGVFGPTETIVLADQTANPVFCAADLIAQAEHDPMASAILVTDSTTLVDSIEAELDHQIACNPRAETIRHSLERQGCVVLVDEFSEAIAVANHIAPEHLCLMVANPWVWAGEIRNAGGLFLGEFSPEVMGDYIAGPSHVMPTGGTARFSSALSVHHFLRTMPVIGLSPQRFADLGAAALRIAEAEGLPGHASAVQARLDHLAATQPR